MWFQKARKALGAALAACMVLTSAAAQPVFADSERVVTLGADLSKSDQELILKYFGVNKKDVRVIYVTNDEERAFLSDYIPLSVIGTNTLSCAYVKPTSKGGIQVKTANLTWVTSNMIASALSTSGVKNCEVIAACPRPVSGTGALTGVLKAYETAAGSVLQEERKAIAAQEISTVSGIAENIGQDEATQIINNIKIQIIEEKVAGTDYAAIESIVDNAINSTLDEIEEARDELVALSQEEREQLEDLAGKIADQQYDYSEVEETLKRVENNVSFSNDREEAGISGEISNTGETADTDEAADAEEGAKAKEEGELEEDSILLETNESVFADQKDFQENATTQEAVTAEPEKEDEEDKEEGENKEDNSLFNIEVTDQSGIEDNKTDEEAEDEQQPESTPESEIEDGGWEVFSVPDDGNGIVADGETQEELPEDEELPEEEELPEGEEIPEDEEVPEDEEIPEEEEDSEPDAEGEAVGAPTLTIDSEISSYAVRIYADGSYQPVSGKVVVSADGEKVKSIDLSEPDSFGVMTEAGETVIYAFIGKKLPAGSYEVKLKDVVLEDESGNECEPVSDSWDAYADESGIVVSGTGFTAGTTATVKAAVPEEAADAKITSSDSAVAEPGEFDPYEGTAEIYLAGSGTAEITVTFLDESGETLEEAYVEIAVF